MERSLGSGAGSVGSPGAPGAPGGQGRGVAARLWSALSRGGGRARPALGPDHQSNIEGLYIVGELADAPVIKLAIHQGDQVVRRIHAGFGGRAPAPEPEVVDVCVVGAGPAGVGAALACVELGLSYVLLERGRPFETLESFPKKKPIFTEPRDLEIAARLPLEDGTKEEVLARWREALTAGRLEVRQGEEVTGVERRGGLLQVTHRGAGGEGVVRARRVVLATGRSGNKTELGVEGEKGNLRIAYQLEDPERHRGERVLVVGGGDSAVEAALALAAAGAEVTVSYRGAAFIRPKAENRAKLEAKVAAGQVRALLETRVVEIGKAEALLAGRDGERTAVPYDRIFVLIGNQAPAPFLARLGVAMEGALSGGRLVWLLGFALTTYLFYCIKAKRALFPFGADDPLGFVHRALEASLGFRAVDGGFWGTVIYSALITGFGVQAIEKYRSPEQTRRYLTLITFQLLFLFGIPELLAPLVIREPWKLYSLSVPWPLSIWSLIHAEAVWMILGAATAFVAVPLFVRFHGERFCSWACGCGGLAETLGDRWRHLAPRGPRSERLEKLGLVILGAAAVTTLIILGHDVFGFLRGPAWTDTKLFVQHWYGLMVDFWFASVIGVAFYPYLGNRVWCRFLCPLRAYMELIAKRFTRIRIDANDKCIGCGECTRYCQMGIEVQRFAQEREVLSNHNSACIQCGICVEVCPMDVLSVHRSETSVHTEVARRGKRRLPVVS